MKTVFTFLLAFILTFSAGFAQNVGDSAPDFMLDDLNGMSYTLSANRGNVVAIFLVGYSCPLCIASAPNVQSTVFSPFQSNEKFHALVIDTWNGSKAAFQNFKSSTGMDARYLQKGQNVASNLSMSYDRLVVVDAAGKIVFKGSRAAGSDAGNAKSAVQTALNNITTDAAIIENNGFWVGQNYPNPVRTKTNLEFVLPQNENVDLKIIDITGKIVAVPENRNFPAGRHTIELDLSEINSGIYFYRFEAGKFSTTQKILID